MTWVDEANTAIQWILHPTTSDHHTNDLAALPVDQQWCATIGHRGFLPTPSHPPVKTPMQRKPMTFHRTLDTATATLRHHWNIMEADLVEAKQVVKGGLPTMDVGLIPMARQERNMGIKPAISQKFIFPSMMLLR